MMGFPDDLLDRYAEPAEIGRGGMGTVFSCVEKATGQTVAVKILDASLSAEQEMRDRFLDEVRIASKVQHPHVVRVLGSGETVAGQLYMVAEMVVGATVRKILDHQKKLPAPKVTGIGRALLAGLAAIHDAGIIHRDLKPGNLLVDRQGAVKIIDFGIARDTADKIQRTRTGTLMGSPSYLPPEQIRGEPTTPASDVYSAGAILYEAVAGRPPFVGDNLFAVLSAHVTESAPPLESFEPDVPKALARVIHRMLAREPGDRYADGREALIALKSASGDRSLSTKKLKDEPEDLGASLMGRHTANGMPVMPRRTRPVAPTTPPRSLPTMALLAAGGLLLLAVLTFVLGRMR